MAITKIVETQKGRSGGVSLGGGYERHHTRAWLVVSSDGSDGDLAVVQAVMNHASIAIGSVYQDEFGVEFDNFALCDSIEATASDNLIWSVVATFNLLNPAFNQINPLDNRPRVSVEPQPEQEIFDVDLDGNPVVASNGLPFDPGASRDRNLSIIRVEQNRPFYDKSVVTDLKDAINSDIFLGEDPGTVKVLSVTANDDFNEFAGKYWIYNFQFAVDKNGWKKKIPDMGYHTLDKTTGKYKQILIDGSPATQPCPLDGNGGLLTPPVDSSSVVVLEFKAYPEADLTTATGFDESIYN